MRNIADVTTVTAVFLLVLGQSLHFVRANYNYYGDKTAYNWLYGDNTSVIVDQWSSFHLDGQNCSVIHVSAVIREGFPWPTIEDTKRITLLYEKLKSSISSLDTSQYNFLKSWVNFYEYLADPDRFLFYRRLDDFALIGERFAKRLLFFLKNNKDELKFISSSKLKAIASTAEFRKQFIYTLTGVKANQIVNDLSDRLLRYYENSARVESYVRSKEFLKEYYQYRNGSYFQNVTKELNKRLNLVNSKLDEGEVELLYLMCPYDRACFNRPDWCNMLTDREKDIIGYFRDLKMYYTQGYGNQAIPEVACPLLQNIFSGMDESIEGPKMNKSYTKGVFRFGHSQTLMTLYAALGMFKDKVPLRADNYETMKRRKFNTTQMTPQSANLVFVLYECSSRLSSEKKYVVKMFQNEAEVEIPNCSGKVCVYQDLRALHAKNIVCDPSSIASIASSHTLILLLTTLYNALAALL